MADGLLNKASIILTPTGYKAGTLYNVAPVVEPYEDFDFARASVASRVNSSGLVEMVGRTLGSELVQNGDFSEIGPELVTNGDFATDSDWTLTGGWSIADNKLSCDGTNDSLAYQSLSSLNLGDTLKVTYTISDYTSGTLRIGTGAALQQPSGIARTSSGTYVEYITKTDGVAAFGFRSYSFNGSIDNVSVKQVDPNDYWTLGTGVTIEEDKLKIDGGALQGAEQNNVITSGLSCKVTFTVSDYVSGTVNLRHPLNKEVTANGTYTFYGDANSAKVLIRGNAVSNEFNITNVSVKEIIDTNNIPRISYDSNGDNGHILLEPTSTNLITYSEDFTTWTVNSATTVYSNTTETLSPSGEYNASKITSDGSNGLYKVVAFSGGDNTKSIFLKGIVGGEQVKLKDPSQTITTETLTLTTDWVRYDLSENQTLNTGLWIDDIPSNGIYMWGAQLESLPYATSYIPTLTGSTEVRATETATGAGSADLINSTEGVLYAEIAALVDTDTTNPNRGFSISSGSTNNTIYIYYQSAVNKLACILISNGTTQFSHSTTLFNVDDYLKIALKYRQNDFALWVDGVEVATDTSGNAPSGLNRLAFDNGAGNDVFYGKCKALAVFNEALSDDELNNLTG